MGRSPEGRHAATHARPPRAQADAQEPRARTQEPAAGTRVRGPAARVRLLGVSGVVLAVAAGSLAIGLDHHPAALSARDTADAKVSRSTAHRSTAVQAQFGSALRTSRSAEHAARRTQRRHVTAHGSTSPSASPSVSASGTAPADVSVPPPVSPSAWPSPAVTPSPTVTPLPSTTPSATVPSSGLTPTATAENQTPTGANQLAWSEAILNQLGDPLTSANIVSLGYWMQNEAGSPPSGIVGANNPINVSEPGFGGTAIKPEGPSYNLMSYPTVQDGVEATAAYLNHPYTVYTAILAALKAGVGLSSSSLGSEFLTYSGQGYSTVPDSWGASQGTPES